MEILQKQHFYDGQVVTPNNMNELLNYTENCLGNAISNILGYGIIEGFEISHKNNWIINISPGLAYDINGKKIYSNTIQEYSLYDHIPSEQNMQKTIKLGIIEKFLGEDYVTDILDETVPTILIPTIEIVSSETIQENVFYIADIIIDQSGIQNITSISNNFTTLINQINNTSSFQKTIDKTKIEDNNEIKIISPLFNIITSQFKINEQALFENGQSNYNTYFKFNNGIMICFGAGLGSNKGRIVVYPYIFHGYPTILSTIEGDSHNLSICAGSITQSTFKAYTNVEGMKIHWLAIGYWKKV